VTGIVLKTEGLSKSFGGLRAVDEVDFELPSGGLHAIIGPNGAGKTTFFNLITSAWHGHCKSKACSMVSRSTTMSGLPPIRVWDSCTRYGR
jgi:branched-chain amino acid transport system ATP-binding protein